MSAPDERTARELLCEAMVELERRGLNHNTAGNASIRVAHEGSAAVLVTPTGVAPRELTPSSLVLLDADGTPARPDQLLPTSEWRLHVGLLGARREVTAVVHTHSPEATAASIRRAAVPAVHYVVARFGTSQLRCAPYATYGTPELADSVATTLGTDGRACLMANHGAIALGATLAEALELAHDVEWLCAVWRRARQLGEPAVLPDDEIARVAERFGRYGQSPV